jgi:hypothetical protein
LPLVVIGNSLEPDLLTVRSMDSDYVQNDYFKVSGVDTKHEHCIGNSCDNLVAMEHTQVPMVPVSSTNRRPTDSNATTAMTAPEALRQSRFIQKPFRSEPEEGAPQDRVGVRATSDAVPKAVSQDQTSPSHGAAALQSDYYQEIRRRSLEGRAPVPFSNHSAYTMEESTGGEDFNVALY